jgi:hypothetical protein
VEGEQLKLTWGETAWKAVGLQPSRLAEHYAQKKFADAMEQDRRDHVQDIAGALARAIRTEDEALFDRTVDKWMEYNNYLMERGRLADLVTPEAVMASVERRFKPVYPDVSEKKMLLRREGRRLSEVLAGEERPEAVNE